MDRETSTIEVIGSNGESSGKASLDAFLFAIPDKKDFDNKQFMEAPKLKEIGDMLISRYDSDFGFLEFANIVYLWKESGGESGGYATLGKCIKPTGLAAYFATEEQNAEKVDFVIWAAADHLRDNKATYRTACALIFHELSHARVNEKGFIVVGHEFEGFAREIEEFGMWQHSIRRIAEACETVKDVQQGLFTNLG